MVLLSPAAESAQCELVWWLGPTFMFKTALEQSQIISIFERGPHYCGDFQSKRVRFQVLEDEAASAQGEVLSPDDNATIPQFALDPARILFSFHATNVLSRAALFRDDILGAAVSTPTSALATLLSYVGETDPGIIVPNSTSIQPTGSSSGLEGNSLPFGSPFAVLSGGVCCLNSSGLSDAIRMVGGVQTVLPFLARAATSNDLQKGLMLLCALLFQNPKNLKVPLHFFFRSS